MVIADTTQLPKLGEYIDMKNIDGKIERLKAVLYASHIDHKDNIRVFFASDNPNDNLLELEGIRYNVSRTYIDKSQSVRKDVIINGNS